MASVTFSNALLPLAGTEPVESKAAEPRGFFARLGAAMIESRRRAAERELARVRFIYGIDQNDDTKAARGDLPFGG